MVIIIGILATLLLSSFWREIFAFLALMAMCLIFIGILTVVTGGQGISF